MRTLEAAARRLKPAPASRPGHPPLPRLWLFTDPVRLPDPLAAAARLPRGAGVVARGLAPGRLAALARLARGRGLALLVAGDGRAALRLRAGLHLPERRAATGLPAFLAARRRGARWARLTRAGHPDGPGSARAARPVRGPARPDLVFLSPAFPTRSHPGALALGPLRWAALAARRRGPAGGVACAALGGVAPGTAPRLPRHGAGRAAGLAAIGALTRTPLPNL